LIKKSIYIAIIGFAIIGYIIYDSRKGNVSKGGDISREVFETMPDNLKNIWKTLSEKNYAVTSSKKGDNPTISFKPTANGLNYSVVIKTQGEILIYDSLSGTPYRLNMTDSGITNAKGKNVYVGEDFANGILQIITNKDYE